MKNMQLFNNIVINLKRKIVNIKIENGNQNTELDINRIWNL